MDSLADALAVDRVKSISEELRSPVGEEQPIGIKRKAVFVGAPDRIIFEDHPASQQGVEHVTGVKVVNPAPVCRFCVGPRSIRALMLERVLHPRARGVEEIGPSRQAAKAGKQTAYQQIRVVDGRSIAGQVAEERALPGGRLRNVLEEERTRLLGAVEQAGVADGRVSVQQPEANEGGRDRVRSVAGIEEKRVSSGFRGSVLPLS